MANDENTQKAMDVAHQIAIREIVQHLVALACKNDDRSITRSNLANFEASVVGAIHGRRHFDRADDATETFVKENAANFVSQIIGKISP